MTAIIDYGAGNIRSVQNALQYLGEEAVLTSDPSVILSADHVILPGVGCAPAARRFLASALACSCYLNRARNLRAYPVLAFCRAES